MGKFLILSVADHEEHILNKIIEAIANEPELDCFAVLGTLVDSSLDCVSNFV